MSTPDNSRKWEASWILTDRTTLADCATDYKKGKDIRTQATNEARATRAKHPRRTESSS
ncbi:hypothetical protein OG440_38890 (plasmid) [Streptomyces sp. NBC_00637]|uniref:hypothetical protein n=1 Tax=Streptomyces sp. NBC_00637 TaxID=2903667 RepID=UPI002F90BBE0